MHVNSLVAPCRYLALLLTPALLHGSDALLAAEFTNGSFEGGLSPGLPIGNEYLAGSTAIPGWTVGGGGVDHIVNTYWQSADGLRSIDTSHLSPGSIWQTFDTDSGEAYEVTFMMAGNVDNDPTLKLLNVTAAGASADYTFDTSNRTRENMGWREEVFLFNSIGSSTTLTFQSLVEGPWGAAIDDVAVRRVETPVPSLIASTDFNEPPLGFTSYTPAEHNVELGFVTSSSATSDADPLAAVSDLGGPLSPVFSHRSVAAMTSTDSVDLSGWLQVEVSLAMRVQATTYESQDSLHIFVTNGVDQLDLFYEFGGAAGLNDIQGKGFGLYSATIPDDWTQLALVISSVSNSNAGSEHYSFDRIRIKGLPIPEPTTVTLAALAMLGFAYRPPRRRWRRSSQSSHAAHRST